MSSDQVPRRSRRETPAPSPEAAGRRLSAASLVVLLIAIVLVIDAIAFILVPPFPAGGKPGRRRAPSRCATSRHAGVPGRRTWSIPPRLKRAAGTGLVITAEPSITSTLLTLWIVADRAAHRDLPGDARRSPVSRAGSRTRASGPTSRLRVSGSPWAGRRRDATSPCSPRFFLLILFCNWAGLIPPIGRVEFLRAPTSDVNVTIGLALVAFVIFEFEGFRRLGVRGYLGQVLPVLRVQERHRRGRHRPVRGPHRADAGVRQAPHAVDATLRQHLRRRGGARRHDVADARGAPGGAARAWSSCSTSSRRSSSAC